MSRAKNYGTSEQVVDMGKGRCKLVPYAQEVAIHRGQIVCEAMMHMAAIRSLRSSSAERNAQVKCIKAHSQTSSATQSQQAAHLLPGQIVVGSMPIWELATTTRPELAGEVERLKQQTQQCFAWTNVLPAEYNRADTEAEGKGGEAPAEALKPLFGAVVQDLWRNARVNPASPLVLDRVAVYAALERWFSEISRIYREASRRKAERGRADEASVLESYGESFRVANVGRFLQARTPQLYQRYEWQS